MCIRDRYLVFRIFKYFDDLIEYLQIHAYCRYRVIKVCTVCLLYTSPSPRDRQSSNSAAEDFLILATMTLSVHKSSYSIWMTKINNWLCWTDILKLNSFSCAIIQHCLQMLLLKDCLVVQLISNNIVQLVDKSIIICAVIIVMINYHLY